MKISAIVSNFNGEIYLERLLASLQAQTGVDLEMIVVDRESTDQSLAILGKYPAVKVVSEPPQTGLVAGYTRGLIAATADLIFFSNEDMYFAPDCLANLQQAIALDQKICAADPWQWDYSGTKLLHAGTRFQPSCWALHSSHPFRNYVFGESLAPNAPIPFACAGAFLIHRQALQAVGGWDTTFFIDNEDVDLFLRLWQNGWKVVTIATARVFHDVGGSLKKRVPALGQMVGKRRYISDWASKAIIAVKYFSWPYVVLNLLNGGLRWLNHLRHGRGKYAAWDFLVLREFMARLPQAFAYRARHRRENKQNPGEKFFTFPAFQAGNNSDRSLT